MREEDWDGWEVLCVVVVGGLLLLLLLLVGVRIGACASEVVGVEVDGVWGVGRKREAMFLFLFFSSLGKVSSSQRQRRRRMEG